MRHLLALYTYESSESNKLAFQMGDIIQFITDIDGGWSFGRLSQQLGIFPSNFVKELPLDWDKSTRRFKIHQTFNSQSTDKRCLGSGEMIQFVMEHNANWFWGRINRKLEKIPTRHASEVFEELNSTISKTSSQLGATAAIETRPCSLNKLPKYLQAIFPFEAGSETELNLVVGDLIEFIEEVEEGWYRGRLLKNEKIGLFPSNFVTEVLNFEEKIIQNNGQEAKSNSKSP
ncbi:Intersectin-1 [Folsomia candida]|uniref:Intersectin-1 n=2 Tax=Folsomia candida TaxID=158441 RepID=A0A226DTS8_FOLCA|nr:Intersectin-1 [Folsomia candida]